MCLNKQNKQTNKQKNVTTFILVLTMFVFLTLPLLGLFFDYCMSLPSVFVLPSVFIIKCILSMHSASVPSHDSYFVSANIDNEKK